MSWTQRTSAANDLGLACLDSYGPLADTYNLLAQWNGSCNIQNGIAFLSLKTSSNGRARPRFIQGNSTSSASLPAFHTYTVPFSSANQTGNCLVVTAIWDSSIALSGASCADTAGNAYKMVFGFHEAFTAKFMALFVAVNCVAGSNTVTITQTGANDFISCSMSVMEYSGMSHSAPSGGPPPANISSFTDLTGIADSFSGTIGPLLNTFGASIATAETNELLLMVMASFPKCGTPVATGGGEDLPEPCHAGWLMIDEPGLGFIDQSDRIWEPGTFNFSQIVRQRGTSTVQLYVAAGDDYEPTTGVQVCIWNLTDTDDFHEFAGFIVAWKWEDYFTNAGDRIATLTIASLEKVFDTITVPGRVYESMTCGAIFTDLFALADGSPISLGTISAGPTVSRFFVSGFPKLSELFDQLATLAGFIWGVDPETNGVYFHLPTVASAPFVLETTDLKYRQFNYGEDENDYRNRQIIRLSFAAFAHSSELIAPASQSSITLKHKVNEVTNAWFTLNTQNTATGTFTGLPNDGDTITINGGGSTWAPNNLLAFAVSVIDPNGNVQRSTTLGTTGAVEPTWNTVKGGTTSDNTVIWTNEGPVGLSNIAPLVYTFKTTLDNREFGQVLIGATAAECAQNFVDAINAKEDSRAPDTSNPVFSLPTWENSVLNADDASGGTFTVRNKAAGAPYIATLSESCANFTWSAEQTSGGQTNFGTSVCPVAVAGNASTGLVYYPGSDLITLAVPLETFSLQIEYTRLDGDSIAVEDTAEVLARAAIEQSTGKYQQVISNDNASAIEGLAQAQSALAAYSTIPKMFEFSTLTPGLRVGTKLTIALDNPEGLDTLLNGQDWFIQEINATRIMGTTWNLSYPHFLYTVRVINVAQIGSWVAFWEQLAGGSGGASVVGGGAGSGGGALPSTSIGKFAQNFTAATSIVVTHNLGTTDVLVQCFDSSDGSAIQPSSLVATDLNTVTIGFVVAVTGWVTVMG